MSKTAGSLQEKSLETLAFRVLTQATTIVMGIMIARALGPSGKGAFAYAGTILLVLLTISGGQSSAVSWQYAKQRIPSPLVYRAMIRFFYIIVVPLSVALLVVGMMRHEIAVIATSLVFPCAYISQVTLAFFVADGDVRWANLQGLIFAGVLTLGIALGVVLFKGGVSVLFAIWLVTYLLVAFRSLHMVKGYSKGNPVTSSSDVFRQQFSFSMRATLNQLMQQLNFRIDLFIILFMLGTQSLGIYSIAVGIGETIWLLSRPLAFSSVSRVATSDKVDAAQLTIRLLKHAMFMVGVACLVAFFVGPALIGFVYGPQFTGAGASLRWILPGIISYCALPFFGQFFVLQLGRPTLMTIIAAISTVICAVVTVLLIPRFGIVAGAIGTSASYTATLLVMFIIFYRETRVSPSGIFAFTSDDLRQYLTLLRKTVSNIASIIGYRSA